MAGNARQWLRQISDVAKLLGQATNPEPKIFPPHDMHMQHECDTTAYTLYDLHASTEPLIAFQNSLIEL